MAETMNMMSVSVDKFTEIIKTDLEDEIYEPIIGIGKAGVGKTMSIHELTKELKIGYCELRLVTLTEVDMLGIPVIENGRTTYASNALLPDPIRDGEAGILVLDEITSASNTVRAAAYQLLDSKRALGNYKLPDHWKVVALGNGIEDGGVFQGMEAAFLSRAACYRVEPQLEAWKKWAVGNKVNPSVIAYLTFDDSKLHKFNPDEMASVFPCPRSWVALSTKLNKREAKNGGKLSASQVELYAAGCVGEEEAGSFSGFYDYNSKTISAEDILSGKSKGSVVAGLETEVIYIVIQQLIGKIQEELEKGQVDVGKFQPETVQRVANAVNWFLQAGEIRLDYAMIGIRDISQGSKSFKMLVLLDSQFDEMCPEFLNFCNANSIVLSNN